MPNRPHLRLAPQFLAFGLFSLVTVIVGCGALPKPITPQPSANESSSSIKLSLSPALGTITTGQGMAFGAPFIGPVLWSVNGIPGGNPALGTVDLSGHYTAPLVPPAGTVTLTANLGDSYQNPAALSASASVEVVNPVPALTGISPDAIPLGSSQGQIILTGSGFNPTSQVSLDAQPLTTKFVNSEQLLADLPASVLSTARVCTITVSNRSPGGGSSAAPMTVLNPAPQMTALSPQMIIVGSPDVPLLISGSGFVPQSTVTAGGQSLTGIFVDAQHLSARVPASLIAGTGLLGITVANPGPGGGVSAVEQMAVVNPAPVLSTISPQSVLAGSTELAVSLIGSGFNAQSLVLVNQRAVSAVLVDAQHLAFNVPPSLMLATGELQITVSNPGPGGGASAGRSLSVANPPPVLATLSPSSVLVGSPDQAITILGTGFEPDSHVQMNGQPLPSQFISATQLSVTVSNAALAEAGLIAFSVLNDAPGGGASATSTFFVLNPQPRINAISPSATFAGSGAFTVLLSGAGYVPQSSVFVNGQSVSSTWGAENMLSATVPAVMLASSGQLQISVVNPEPGGGSSSAQTITILANGEVVATNNPQVASYSLTIPGGAKANVEFGEHDYSLSTSAITATTSEGHVRILVAGMKPNAEYHMRGIVQMPDGDIVSDVDHTFYSGSLPQIMLPTLVTTRTGLGKESPGIQLFDNLDRSRKRVSLFAADLDGNIIWTYFHSSDVTLYQPAKLLEDGNVWLGTLSSIREVNLAGETLQEITIDQINAALAAAGYSVSIASVHHDLLRLANGHLIVLGGISKDVTLDGDISPTHVLGDVIIDLDPKLNVAWFWNSFEHLDVNRHPISSSDWTHGNALARTPDGNLLFSMRNQSWVIKIEYLDGQGHGDTLWRLGYGGDFSLPGSNPADWFYTQHNPAVLDESLGHMVLAVFDDGANRILDSQGDSCGIGGQPACYSRAVIFDLDEQALKATIKWQNPLNDFTFWGGSIQQLANGNVLAALTETGPGTRVLEMSSDVPSLPIWEMDVIGQNAYRSIRYPSLYPGVQWP